MSFQKTLNSHFRKALRKRGGILRPFYDEATLMFKFSTPTLSAEPPVWAHVSYVNLTTLMGAWAKMKEDSDSVNGRTAAAVGHCALVPDITDMVRHPLGLHLTLDFVDTFLDRRFPLRCSAWSLRASPLPQPRRVLLGGEQIAFALPWSKLVWDPACLLSKAKDKKSDGPPGADVDSGDGASSSGSSSGDEDKSTDDSSSSSGSESDESTGIGAGALRAATRAEREAGKRTARGSGDDSDTSLFMPSGDEGGCGGGRPPDAPTGIEGGSGGDSGIGGVDVLGTFVDEILPEPAPEDPPASPTPAAADPAASSSPDEERVRHERYHGGVEWTYVPVPGGWIVFAPGHGQIHAHCDPHKGIIKCRCHKTIAVGKNKGRPMGFLLLWLSRGHAIDALLHHSKDYKKILAMPAFHEERSTERRKHKDNPDLAEAWKEEEPKENADDDSEFETVK